MSMGLLDHAVPGVDQHDGGIRRGGAGNHVPGVLNMPGCICNDELSVRRGKIAVCHVDGDSLFPLGAKPVGEQRQVEMFAALLNTRTFNRVELVFENRFAVV